ncbi:inner centromere protein-like [Lingula anatina]|uniref:Inner centromere protein-like n=1 Tax=Lingula anatina TaxID=7574 RepID=A0A2R2MT42_LINAN|nr:inner centromere protein-like [Lingula anatina]|eukprot:XP_023933192.1 inner centromere protein-like [Lingula anatina]
MPVNPKLSTAPHKLKKKSQQSVVFPEIQKNEPNMVTLKTSLKPLEKSVQYSKMGSMKKAPLTKHTGKTITSDSISSIFDKTNLHKPHLKRLHDEMKRQLKWTEDKQQSKIDAVNKSLLDTSLTGTSSTDRNILKREKNKIRMQRLRSDPQYRKAEQNAQRITRSQSHVKKKIQKHRHLKRSDPEYRKNEQQSQRLKRSQVDEKSKILKYNQLKRSDPQYRKSEQESHRLKRSQVDEKSKILKYNQLKRSDPQYRKSEQESQRLKRSQVDEKSKILKYNQLRRSDPHYRKKEQESHRLKRSQVDEKSKILKYNQLRRSDPQYRKKEQESQRLKRSQVDEKSKILKYNQLKRSDPQYRKKEQESQRLKRSQSDMKTKILKHKHLKRSDPYYKVTERSKKRLKRSDPEFRKHERKSDSFAKCNKRQKINTNLQQLIQQFHKKVAEGCTYTCCICQQLWYRHTVINSESIMNLENNAVKHCKETGDLFDSNWICLTCSSHLKKNKIPPCAMVNGLSFPEKPSFLDLKPLEWRLTSPRLVFMKLQQAPRGKQYKLEGNVVNIPADVTSTVTKLPRTEADSSTIKVQLKRNVKFKNYAYAQNVRPNKVLEAAAWLTANGKLYQEKGITVDTTWKLAENPCSSDTFEQTKKEHTTVNNLSEEQIKENTTYLENIYVQLKLLSMGFMETRLG